MKRLNQDMIDKIIYSKRSSKLPPGNWTEQQRYAIKRSSSKDEGGVQGVMAHPDKPGWLIFVNDWENIFELGPKGQDNKIGEENSLNEQNPKFGHRRPVVHYWPQGGKAPCGVHLSLTSKSIGTYQPILVTCKKCKQKMKKL